MCGAIVFPQLLEVPVAEWPMWTSGPALQKADIVDPHTRLRALISKWETRLQNSFTQMLTRIKDTQTLDELAALIEANQFERAFVTARAHAGTFANQVNAAYLDSAVEGQTFLLNHGIVVDFGGAHPRAVNAMATRKLRLVNGFMRQTEDSIRQVMTRGVQEGLNPRATARLFRDSIGLTPRQEQYVANYEQQLRELDGRALNRKLRDGRFDRSVKRAIANDKPLADKQISKMTERYRQRWVKFRAETIARTETLPAVHEGNREVYDQALEQGSINAEELEREWHTSIDGRQRDSHDHVNGSIVGHEELYETGAGNLLAYPGDPSAPDEDVVMCRCAESTRIKGGA